MTQLQVESMHLKESLTTSLAAVKLPAPTKATTPASTICASHVTREELQSRKRFCVFLKILSSYLERTDSEMHQRVKQLVRHCTRMNRERDIKYLDLTKALQVRLQSLIGEKLWCQCHAVADFHLLSRQTSTVAASAAATTTTTTATTITSGASNTQAV
mmetsp:Transcript_9282/g.15551  ORF Transcript_9282/g.15551 Transcript_9282/m.15551 type:complete len:159 (-) Transcript_9282:444-920(-)|eukprot:CAMPEP_0116553650 /NCGR_PEP_ID=MMETSP0397-20121206/7164_1 /TAXON_ID=216820 /ORGANISM="Cyclophora tenuis, Strain ECT3854" /LENGTH=158 /DNA_ID=CAMNT_0004078743 /DNA_START=42 /DNA_END=518 /DNA_ORIENTATION=+